MEFGHNTWKAATTTTLPRRAESSSGRSVLNQVCTSSSGAYVEVVMNRAHRRCMHRRHWSFVGFMIHADRLLCARSRHELQEAARTSPRTLANSWAMG